MDATKDYYGFLGVLPTAEAIVIRAAYKALAQRYHPDRCQGASDEAQKRMAEINEAYTVLSQPQSREQYDELRGSMAQDASSFFDESARPNNSFDDPLAAEWEIAVDFYPDLLELEGGLSKVSSKLAYTFKAHLLESKLFENRKTVAAELEQQFLKLFFGENVSIVQFAKGLIVQGDKTAAIALNNAVRVLGVKSNPNVIIRRIAEKYKVSFVGDQKLLIDSVRNCNLESARQLLMGGVDPSALCDQTGRSLTGIARDKGDQQMLKLLMSYGVSDA